MLNSNLSLRTSLPRVDGCKALTPAQLDEFRDDLIALVHRASSLQVTDPLRHIRALIEGGQPDPALFGKRLVVTEAVFYRGAPGAPVFQFPGTPTLAIGAPRQGVVLEEKLTRGGLAEEVQYMRDRERAAEYHLLEDIARRPGQYPELLTQLEQMVLGECVEAHLRARQSSSPYGPAMMIDMQDRLRRLAFERPEMIRESHLRMPDGCCGPADKRLPGLVEPEIRPARRVGVMSLRLVKAVADPKTGMIFILRVSLFCWVARMPARPRRLRRPKPLKGSRNSPNSISCSAIRLALNGLCAHSTAATQRFACSLVNALRSKRR